MKKTPLVFFILTPMLLIGCNKNSSLSFNNPFPEDTYNKTGFNFKSTEIAKGSLTAGAKELVNKTAADPSYDQYIKYCKSEIHVRDYMRAFAGVFKQGYNSSNLLIDSYADTYNQGIDGGLTRRKWSNFKSKTISDYSYGKMTSNVDATTYNYLGVLNGKKIQDEKSGGTADRIVTQTKSGNDILTSDVIAWSGQGLTPEYDWAIGTKTNPVEYKIDDAFYIKQSNFIFKVEECTVPAGTYGDEVIIIKETKEQHNKGAAKGEGRVILGDKKEFLAMDNTLTVTKLKRATTPSSDPFYYANYVRQYTETVITSEEIQPNVQITMLANPIVINYTECIYNFALKADVQPTSEDVLSDIDEVEMPEK